MVIPDKKGPSTSLRSARDDGVVEQHAAQLCQQYNLRLLYRFGQNLGDVYRLSVAAVGDLVAAGGAVGNDQRIGGSLAHRRQQRQLGHGERGLVVLGLVAEAAGHAAAARLDHADSEFGYQRKYLL